MGQLYLYLSLLSKLYFYTPFFVEGESMFPTLANHEIIFLDKGVYRKEFPQRGDIVVFSLENEPNYFYVKRVIGLPGDTIKINRQGVYIQKIVNQPLGQTNTYFNKALASSASSTKTVVSRNPFEKLIESYVNPQKSNYEDERIFKIPAGEYFVLGDNRNHSKDSRFFKDPYIAKKQILGKYTFGLKIDL